MTMGTTGKVDIRTYAEILDDILTAAHTLRQSNYAPTEISMTQMAYMNFKEYIKNRYGWDNTLYDWYDNTLRGIQVTTTHPEIHWQNLLFPTLAELESVENEDDMIYVSGIKYTRKPEFMDYRRESKRIEVL